jgi:predicted DNA-binding transcriptional regulator AlpA
MLALIHLASKETIMSEPVLLASARATNCGLEPLLTIADLEQLLRVDRRTVSRLCEQGKLPRPIKIGGSNRWTVKAIESVLASHDDKDYEDASRGGVVSGIK